MGDYVLSWADHAYMFFFGLVVPIIILLQGKPDIEILNLKGKQKIALYYSNGLMMWLGTFLVFLIWYFNERSFIDFGFRLPQWHWIAMGAAVIILLAYIGDLMFETIIPKRKVKTVQKWKENTPFLPVNWHEYKHFTFAAFSAGFCEEIIFRGFMINYILALSGGHWSVMYVAIILPAIVFGALHIYQGHVAVNKIIIGGLLFGLIYYYSQSLWIVVAIHFGIDLLSAYVYMHLMKDQNVNVILEK